MLALSAYPATANTLYEDAIFVEGVGLDSLDAIPQSDPLYPIVTTGAAANVMVGWSDDIIYHQFPAGQKVRTEVLLHVVQTNSDGTMAVDANGAAIPLYTVYTITAHFMIQQLDANGVPVEGVPIYSSCIAAGLWVDGPTDAYSAEVNIEGNLLYGYNWDTRDLSSGWYRLTFWIDVDEFCPDSNPITGTPITYPGVDICFGDPLDVDDAAGDRFGFVTVLPDQDLSYLDLFLTEKTSGRGQSGK